MINPITTRGSSECRGCRHEILLPVLDLGLHPLPAEYALEASQVLDTFPLQLRICPKCGLGQVGEYVFPDRIFHENYPYLSSASTSWVQHAKSFCIQTQKDLHLDHTSLVVELASNDGYLLSEYQQLGVKVLGVEPAQNVASMAVAKGVETIVEFFGNKIAREIVSNFGHPRLIIANNVYAHIPDMMDFTAGLATLADDKTLISIENPSFMVLLKNNLFDTIYHEHYSYLSVNSVSRIAKMHGLTLFNVDVLSTHGGSYRYWLSKTRAPDPIVEHLIQNEVDQGLFDSNLWNNFAINASKSMEDFRNWIIERDVSGDVVVGYGAAHKGNTFLNAVGSASKIIKYVVDASPEKQGKFLPGSQIPVLSPAQLDLISPTDVVILPWNISTEIKQLIGHVCPNAKIWVAQPELKSI